MNHRIRPLRLIQRLSTQHHASFLPRTFISYGLVQRRNFSSSYVYQENLRVPGGIKIPTSPAGSPAAKPLQGDAPKASTTPLTREKSPTTPEEQSVKSGGLLNENVVSTSAQRKADWAIIKEMSQYLWPKNNWGTRFRVGLALSLLVGAKLLNVQIPFYFKSIVDSMNVDFMAIGGTAWTVAGSLIVACMISYSPTTPHPVH
jgi:hypothetical protein